MTYVFDTNVFSDLFKSYYRSRFPTLWVHFDGLVDSGNIVSTREVRREIENSSVHSLIDWCKANAGVFSTPTAAEAEFVREIYSVTHFQQNIEQKKLLKGGLNADPFIIAKANAIGGTVVALEREKPKAVKVPNICTHFHVPCMNLEQFMEAEGWSF